MEKITPEEIQLTQYSHGAGCGCKISPKVLDTILESTLPKNKDTRLLVGNDQRDDAAVYDLGNGNALISTTDFFMPIVDNPFDFGRIAATNAISDIYAMGGSPILAIAILGWPINKIPPEVAQLVLDGARSVCSEAGISIAGGHSIDSPEPIFGLAVNGLVKIEQLKKNATAEENCLLYLTKPIGVGVLSTAQKRNLLKSEDRQAIIKSMTTLNKIGQVFSQVEGVMAMTDVTGFGVLGHLCEMCEGSGISAELDFQKVPTFESLDFYLEQNCIPGGTARNWESYGYKISPLSERKKQILCDPQTSGGLMVAVREKEHIAFEKIAKENGLILQPIGRTIPKREDCVIQVV